MMSTTAATTATGVVRPCAARRGLLAGSVARPGRERAIISWGSWPRNTLQAWPANPKGRCRLPETAVVAALGRPALSKVARHARSARAASWVEGEGEGEGEGEDEVEVEIGVGQTRAREGWNVFLPPRH